MATRRLPMALLGLTMAATIVVGAVGASHLGGAAATTSAPSPNGAVRAQTSPCTGTIASGVSSETVRICDAVTVTLRTVSACPSRPLHFVMIGTSGTALRPGWLSATLKAVTQELQSGQSRGLDVKAAYVGINGVVEDWCPGFDLPYGKGARTLVDLTDDLDELNSLRFAPGQELCSDYVAGATEASRILARARKATGVSPTEMVAFFAATTYGLSAPPECTDRWRAREMLLAAGQRLRGEVPTLLSVCTFDIAPDPGCHIDECDSARKIAPRYRYSQQNTGQAVAIVGRELEAAASEMSAVGAQTIVQVLPAGLEYVDASASEPLTSIAPGPAGTRLVWARSAPAATLPLTLTYRVKPRAEGRHAITGTMAVTDTDGLGAVVPMQPVTVTVSGLCETPTPEPSPTAKSTATAVATSTLAATTTPTASATPTATRVPLPAYLPLALREEPCVPEKQRVDVALVIDASTSMDQAVRTGSSKLDAARAAAGVLLGALRLDAGDQAAVVTFNAQSELLQELTSDRPSLDRALVGIRTAQQTRIHRGIETARLELASGRHRPTSASVMVVLTDGQANPDGPAPAVVEAALAKAHGITVFTVGLGNELDFEALEQMASRSEYFFRAPDAGQLEAIYRAIAVEMPCPASQFWGGR